MLEAEAVPIIAGWIDRVADLMTSEEGRLRLRASLLEKLQAGTIPRMQVIAAADAGDQDADQVLRELDSRMHRPCDKRSRRRPSL